MSSNWGEMSAPEREMSAKCDKVTKIDGEGRGAAGGRDEEPPVNKKNTEPQAARAWFDLECFGRDY